MIDIFEYMEEVNPEALYPTDLKDAVVDVVYVDGQTRFLVDSEKAIRIFIERDGMTEEEAIEFFDYNVIGSFGEQMPVYTRYYHIDF